MSSLKPSEFKLELEQAKSFNDAFKLLIGKSFFIKKMKYTFIPQIRKGLFLTTCTCSKNTRFTENSELYCLENKEFLSHLLTYSSDRINSQESLLINWAKSIDTNQIDSPWLCTMLNSTFSQQCYTVVMPYEFKGTVLLSFTKNEALDSEEGSLNEFLTYVEKFHQYSILNPLFSDFVAKSILQKFTATEKNY